MPPTLHKVDANMLQNQECEEKFHRSNHVNAMRDVFVCERYVEGFKDFCERDSGQLFVKFPDDNVPK